MKKFILISIFFIVSCSEQSEYEQNLDLVSTIEASNKTEGAFWLEQNVMGTWAKEVLVFGYMDNYEGCLDFIEINIKKYGGTYRCVEVN
tara:strand:- start:518 stop:784 length:267 start_codon:yes stop_codon:yes gene_type:complete